MKKSEFLAQLERLASALPEADREKLLEYYAEIIDDRMEEGLGEEQAVAALGDPLSLADGLDAPAPAAGEAAGDGETVPALNGLRLRVTGADVLVRREALANGAAAQLRFSDPARFAWRMDGDTLEITQPEADAPRFSLRWIQQMLAAPAQRVTVALAQGLAGALDFEGGGGDLAVEGASLGKARLASSSGDIALKDVACGGIDIHTHSGDVKLADVRAAGLSAGASSGDISARGLSLEGPLALETASGDVTLRDLACADVRVATGSGDIQARRVRAAAATLRTASGDMELDAVETDPTLVAESASGDIALTRCIARRTRLKSASGDLSLRLAALPCGYALSAHTVSGDVRLPRDNPPAQAGVLQPEIALQTTSGDIDAAILPG